MKIRLWFLLIVMGWTGMISAVSPLSVRETRCEYLVNPVGVDVPNPRFFWKLESPRRGDHQTAYQLLIESQHSGGKGATPVWDSQKTTSPKSTFVRYGGPRLCSGERYTWRVRVWDREDTAGEWSEPAAFTTGMLRQSDWQAKWIGSDLDLMDYQKELRALPDFNMESEDDMSKRAGRIREMTSGVVEAPAVYLRREFDAPAKPVRATVFACGLGLYELYINGCRIGDRVLEPAYTDYEKRVMYSVYDATEAVQ